MKNHAIIYFRTVFGSRVTVGADHISSYQEVCFFRLFNHVKIVMTNGTVFRVNETYERFSKIIDPILKS